MSLEKMMEPTGEMAPEQISAIKRSIEIGSLLVNDHPEIAKLYRDGMTHSGIAENLDVKGKYDISSDKVAVISIYRAITGHADGFKIEPYDGLISDLDELAGLEHEHRANGGRKTAELGLGVHAINPETGLSYRAEGGRKATELGSGAHGINPETGERYVVEGGRIGGRIGGRKTALARGQTLWREEETERAYLLSLEPEYQHQKGRWKGKGDYKTIAQVLNDDYHNGEDVRSPGTVKRNLSTYRKTLGN
jgi:hypothetical protein